MSIIVKDPGLYTTIQDLGRNYYQKYGVVVSGAMDQFSFRLANVLLGNNTNAAALEITLKGPTLTFFEDTIVAICGATFKITIDGQAVPMNRPVLVKKGAVLKFGECLKGCRAYLAIKGGFKADIVLQSSSTYEKGKIGGIEGRRLKKGDQLFASDQTKINHPINWKKVTSFFYTTKWFVTQDIPYRAPVRVIRGRQASLFSEEARNNFYGKSYKISTNSDRMGYRLEGEGLVLAEKVELISEGTAFGSIQVPPNGQPIILMADRQTTGGYPKIANVISTDLPLLAQCRPGDTVSFQEVSIDEAEQLFLNRESLLHMLEIRLTILNK